MPSAIRFHFDPRCPWCWITSKWIRRLVHLGEVEADWAVFSLDVVNRDASESPPSAGRSGHALRAAILARDEGGASAIGRFYEAVGTRVHERGERLDDPDVIAASLGDAGLDPALAVQAANDGEAWQRVEAEHTALVERTRSFGVPTIALDGGEGPAMFGPVVSQVPGDEDAVELWRHVEWLTRYANFSELKRERVARPDLPRSRDRGGGRGAATRGARPPDPAPAGPAAASGPRT